jgi:hypothetical protein
MKKRSTIYLLGALVTLASCAREYPVFNQMPKNAYMGQPNRSEVKVQAPASEEVAVVTPDAQNAPETKAVVSLSEAVSEGRVSEMLAENTPRQLDEKLERALATTQGQALMAKPAVAAQINKVRAMMVQDEFQNMNVSDVKSPLVSKIVDKQIKKSMEPAAAKALDNKIRIGLILILVGILVGLIPGIGWAVGSIVAVVGIVFVVLGLIDNI